MNSTLAVITNIPILLLLYVIMYFTQALSGKRQFYGVSLNSDYFSKEEFKSLDKKFKFLLTVGFVAFLIITLISIYVFKAYLASSIIPILGFCVYEFIVFVYIHNKVKSLKKDLALEKNDLELKKTNIILDTDFINEKNKIIKKYSILFLAPFIINIIVAIYLATKYNSIPDIIPTHWGFNGQADAFSQKSFFSVFGIVFMSIGTGIIIYISSINSLKSRTKLNYDNINESKKSHLNYLNKIAFTFFVLNLSCQILFINILIATANASSLNPYIMWADTILLVACSIYLTYVYYKSPSKYKDAVYSVDDDDNNWILGSIYNNPNDPSLFVQKRFGVGWTVNIGSVKGKIFFFSLFIIMIVILFVTYNM